MQEDFDPDFFAVLQTATETIRLLAQRAGLPEPTEAEQAIRKLLERYHDIPMHWVFFMIVDIPAGAIPWQYGLNRAISARPEGPTLGEYLQLIHPDYLAMYLQWAGLVSRVGVELNRQVGKDHRVYHITLPLRDGDGQYQWFTQRSLPLLADGQGQYIAYFTLCDYCGPWSRYNRRPFLPFITHHNRPDTVMERLLFGRMAEKMAAYFTGTECKLIERYIVAEPKSSEEETDNLEKKIPATRYEHNRHILRKARDLFCTDFPSAPEFARFLHEQGLWLPAEGAGLP